MPDAQPNIGRLYVICCAAPPAQDLPFAIPKMMLAGWDVWVIPTPSAVEFLEMDTLTAMIGHPIRSSNRRPDDERLPPADAILVAPLTFNTLNKWSAGIMDTFALGVLTEAIGTGIPVVAVPWAKTALTSHPAFARNLALLTSCGVDVISHMDTVPAEPVAARQRYVVPAFPWDAASMALSKLEQSSTSQERPDE